MRWWLAPMLVTASAGCGTAVPTPTDTGTDFEVVCAEVNETASRVPVNLLLTIDRSGSMNDGDPPKWDAMSGALTTFLETPDAQDLRVGLRLWPDEDGCNDTECDATVCSQPQVEVASLEDEAHRTAILDQLVLLAPEDGGKTPMSAALEGARTWAQTVQASVPDEQVAIALLTDGIPNGCDESIENISTIAADALTDGAPTYVMGIEGSREEDVAQIALAGGTKSAFLVGGGTKAEADLLAALLAIQGDVLSCSYDFPMGAELDPARIRIELDIDGEMVRLPRVDDETMCADGGFFLTQDGARITLCDATCEALRDTLEAEIDIAIGCVCETDEDCPEDEMCEDNVCVPEDTAVDTSDPGLRVQGGATRCQHAPGFGLSWLALLGFAFVRRRTT